MANWHLTELRAALEKRGWKITEQPDAEERGLAAIWQLTRAGDARTLFVDFAGWDGNGNLKPMAESHACKVRGTDHSVYFSRRGERNSSARKRWESDLASFVKGLD
jgi:hypothetical protein